MSETMNLNSTNTNSLNLNVTNKHSETKSVSSPFQRSGTHRTIYELKRNPESMDKDYLAMLNEDDEKMFPFMTGSSYSGEWKDTLKHGVGIETFQNGVIYEGEFQFNKRHGTGTLYKSNNVDRKSNNNTDLNKTKTKMSSSITKKLSGKDKKKKIYDGHYINGLKDGQGIFYYKNDDIYSGNWKEDKRHGYGVFVSSATGSVYEGSWLNGLQDAMGGGGHNKQSYRGTDDDDGSCGCMYYKNGNIYKGGFSKGMKEGSGKFFYASSGKLYDGEWNEDQASCGEFRDPTEDENRLFDQLAQQYSTLHDTCHKLLQSNNNSRSSNSNDNSSYNGSYNISTINNNATSTTYNKPTVTTSHTIIRLPELGLADSKEVLQATRWECQAKRNI